jgi:glycosyltransferase involved in cell wall biosynthesis
LRILNVVQIYFPYLAGGGMPVKVRTLSQTLAHRGHSVTILTTYRGASEWRAEGITPEETADGFHATEGGIEAIYLPSWPLYRTLTFNPDLPRVSKALLQRTDLVHFYGLYDFLGPMVSHYCRRDRVPYVIEPMGMYRPIDRNFAMKRLWHRTIGKSFLRGAAKFIATSELEERELLDGGISPKKVAVRYNGVDPSAFMPLPPRGEFRAKWNISRDQPLVLLLSRLIPRKGADILIDAFADACPPSARLVIAGPEGERGYVSFLQQRARERNVESRVVFPGPVYGEEKKALLADADLFVLPSRYENFANAPAEAIACGVPVIISDACGIRSLVDGQAGLVIPPAKDALSAALRAMLSDRALYDRMRDGCSGVAAQLSWDRVTEQMEHYYADALGPGRPCN